jgi:hypothetical protein
MRFHARCGRAVNRDHHAASRAILTRLFKFRGLSRISRLRQNLTSIGWASLGGRVTAHLTHGNPDVSGPESGGKPPQSKAAAPRRRGRLMVDWGSVRHARGDEPGSSPMTGAWQYTPDPAKCRGSVRESIEALGFAGLGATFKR